MLLGGGPLWHSCHRRANAVVHGMRAAAHMPSLQAIQMPAHPVMLCCAWLLLPSRHLTVSLLLLLLLRRVGCCRSEQDITAGMLPAAVRLPPPDMDSML